MKFAALPSFAIETQSRLQAREPAYFNEGVYGTRASVLIPLFLDATGAPHVWLLRKIDTLRHHAGQVALPGGKPDPGDGSPLHTALREAREEIGLPSEKVTLLGNLDDHVTLTGYVISPFVGYLSEPFAPVPDPYEVTRVFAVPLWTFAHEGSPREVSASAWRGVMPAYEVDGEIIWGATAAILRSLVQILLISLTP